MAELEKVRKKIATLMRTYNKLRNDEHRQRAYSPRLKTRKDKNE